MTSYITRYNLKYKSQTKSDLSKLSPKKLERLLKLAEKVEEEEKAEIRRKSYGIYYCV